MLQCDISSSGEAGQKTARGKVRLLLAYPAPSRLTHSPRSKPPTPIQSPRSGSRPHSNGSPTWSVPLPTCGASATTGKYRHSASRCRTLTPRARAVRPTLTLISPTHSPQRLRPEGGGARGDGCRRGGDAPCHGGIALSNASKRARTRSIGSRSRGSLFTVQPNWSPSGPP